MKISNANKSLQRRRPSSSKQPAATTLGSNDTFKQSAKVLVGTGLGTAVGYGLGSAASMGGFGGATVGAITGLGTGMFILSRFGDGKGGEGIVYPIAGAVIGGVGGLVLGAIGGDSTQWVGAAAGGLAALQALRD